MGREQPDTLRSLKRKVKQEIAFLEQPRTEEITMESHISAWEAFHTRIERMINKE